MYRKTIIFIKAKRYPIETLVSMKILIQYVLNIKVTKEIVMNPMIMIVVLGLLWLVIVFPLYLHYRKENSIRSKSTSLISGKVVG